MTILADMNSIFTNVLLVVHVAVCLLLCLVVLMQRPKQEGLGAAFGGGMTDQAFGARTTDVLQKGTVYLGTIFFIVTFALAVLIGAKGNDARIDNEAKENATAQTGDKDNQDLVNKENDGDNKEETPEEGDKPAEGSTGTPEAPARPETPEQPETPAKPETPAPEAGQ